MEKDYSQNSETGKEYKNHAQILGKGREWKKEIPEIRDWEGNEKLDPVGSTVRYEMMKLCTGSV